MDSTQVKPGYQVSELGVIPEDWNVQVFIDLLEIIDGDRGVNYPKTEDFSDDGFCLFLNAGNVTKNGFKFSNCSFITKDKDLALNKGKLKRKDIVLTTRGTVGNVALYDESIVYDHIRINSGMVLLRNKTDNYIQYIFHVLNSYIFSDQIQQTAFGSAQPQLTVKGINKFVIPIPPLPEQKAIAAALSDVDALITAQEALIAKKRDIKTATMQQLLTGKVRLGAFGQQAGASVGQSEDRVPPGYQQTELGVIPEDWQVTAIGEICSYQNGTAQEKLFNSYDGYKVISIGNYSESGKYIDSNTYIDKSQFDQIKKYILNKNDLTMILNDKTSTGTIIGRVLLIEENDIYVMNQRTMRLTPKGNISSKYLHELINSDLVHSRIVSLAKPGTQIYVNTDDILNFQIFFPKNNLEQDAIVEILSDMDAEITALETQRDKTRAIKQGMMQELLTGKTRLVEPAL